MSDSRTPTSTCRRVLSSVSSSITSIASTSGIPARTKAASCREKCMSSPCGSFFFVTSNLRKLFFSLSLRTSRPWSTSAAMAIFTETASVTPRIRCPPSVTASYLYFTIATSDRVQASDEFGDRCDTVGNELHPAVPERPHALRDRELLDLVVVRFPHEKLLHLLRDEEQLVDADPVLVAGPEAEVAPLSLEEPLLRRAGRLLIELELFDRRLVRHRAGTADPAHEPLTDDAHDRRRDEEGFDAEVEEALDGTCGVGRVERGQDEVARERRLDPDTRGLDVTHLAD